MKTYNMTIEEIIECLNKATGKTFILKESITRHPIVKRIEVYKGQLFSLELNEVPKLEVTLQRQYPRDDYAEEELKRAKKELLTMILTFALWKKP